MLIYIHVPFCRRKCQYCAFHSHPMAAGDLEAYADALLREIAVWGDRLGRREVTSLYFGGGTPSLLPANLLGQILRSLDRAFDFAPGYEFSFEGNPESVAEGAGAYLQELRALGVTRLSLGVQSLNDDRLRLLGRPHTARQARNAYSIARSVGFQNINLDFIWGLPGQRLKLWLDELKEAAALAPEHLSCYGLTVEPGTPLEDRVLDGVIELPDEDEQSAMFIHGADYLENNGFMQYEVSNFARMGYQSRHNLGYWEGTDYLGLGPSAVSTVGGMRWSNPEGIAPYAEAVSDSRVGAEAEKLTLPIRIKELVMLRLRTTRGLRLKAYRELTGRNFLKEHERMIEVLHRNDLIRIRGGYIRFTRAGMLVSNTILENIFAAMPDE